MEEILVESRSSNRKKFKELAEKRVNRTIKDIRLIGNLSNRSNYAYTEDDIRKIFSVLERELKSQKQRFEAAAGGQEIPLFKLSD